MEVQHDTLLGALAPVLESVAAEDAPLLLAWLERLAAEKYRNWAAQATDPVEAQGLLDCAGREEDIAIFIESLTPDVSSRMAEIQQQFAHVPDLYDGVLAGQDRTEQLRRQAAGELGGAGFLRQFAAPHSGAVAAQFEALAYCEEANSRFLNCLIGDDR